MILALETATNVCSVAFCNAEGAVFEKRSERRGSHSEKLFLFIEDLMEEHDFVISDLKAVLLSEGPGSYTGLRIGASAVKGLLFQSGVPLFGINTLASFAMQVADEKADGLTIHGIIDARRVHVYHQQFVCREGTLFSVDQVEVIPIEAFESMVRKGDLIVGTGLKRIREPVKDKAVVYGQEAVTARSLLKLYQKNIKDFYHSADPETFDPRYYTSRQVK